MDYEFFQPYSNWHSFEKPSVPRRGASLGVRAWHTSLTQSAPKSAKCPDYVSGPKSIARATPLSATTRTAKILNLNTAQIRRATYFVHGMRNIIIRVLM